MDELALRRLHEAAGPAATSGCCLSVGADGMIVWAAQAARELDWLPDELVGRNVSVLVPRLGSLLGPAERARVLSRLGPVVRAVAQDERSQLRNRERAADRIVDQLREAVKVPRRRKATKPTKAAREERLYGATQLPNFLRRRSSGRRPDRRRCLRRWR